MKFHFEPNLDYQLQAIEAVCDLFRGQEIYRTEFTVTRQSVYFLHTSGLYSELGTGNTLTLPEDEINKNLKAIQFRNQITPSESLSSTDFTVEMETGTGKTYVYLRTIFELNKRYGFTKFVIVVPSIAIKEGVYKTLQITEEHFKSLYAGTPFNYFLYDSSKLTQVRNFAIDSTIQIMVVTVGAINKRDVNNIYGKGDNEQTGGEKPIDLIRAVRPILIIDEPQSVDGGLQGQGKQALEAMNPLCTLRYSATHVDKHHMVYRLDAVDAYEKRLVKQIEVASATIDESHNKPYVRLVSVGNRRGAISAKVELDVQTVGGVRRQEKTVVDGDNLEQVTGRALYANCLIGEIRAARGNEFMELRVPRGEHYLKPGQAGGAVDMLAVQRQMIRRTIREHLDKEKRLKPQGIKVLSLFFIDEVAKYRQYDTSGNLIKGEYAHIFEDEYRRLAAHPDYSVLFTNVDLTRAAEEAHDGYFAIDKRIHTPFEDQALAKSATNERSILAPIIS
jgi:type III restriction enzyme